MPRDKFMDEVVEGAPMKEKKKRPRKKKQIERSRCLRSRAADLDIRSPIDIRSPNKTYSPI